MSESVLATDRLCSVSRFGNIACCHLVEEEMRTDTYWVHGVVADGGEMIQATVLIYSLTRKCLGGSAKGCM